jgi:hypothetical protein
MSIVRGAADAIVALLIAQAASEHSTITTPI